MNSQAPTALLQQKIKLVVSDFHLGKGRFLPNKMQNLLEDFIYDAEFSEFVDFYCSKAYANAEVELVLNGDLLNLLQIDTWGVHTHLITERSVLRALERILIGHPLFFQALKRFASTPQHQISYIIGNHDAGMLWPSAKKAFSLALGAEVLFYDEEYEFDGIHVEHGHQHEYLARIDPQNATLKDHLPEPVLNLPWGSLFIAVFLPRVKTERSYIDKVRPFSTFSRWVLIHDFWWGITNYLRAVGFTLHTLFAKSKFHFIKNVKTTLMALKEISLYPNFDRIAFKILEQRHHIHTVIFGHTHIVRYRQWREGQEYFNIGTWNETTNLNFDDFGKRVRLTYALIEYPQNDTPTGSPQPTRPKVRLKEWHGMWRPDSDVIA